MCITTNACKNVKASLSHQPEGTNPSKEKFTTFRARAKSFRHKDYESFVWSKCSTNKDEDSRDKAQYIQEETARNL